MREEESEGEFKPDLRRSAWRRIFHLRAEEEEEEEEVGSIEKSRYSFLRRNLNFSYKTKQGRWRFRFPANFSLVFYSKICLFRGQTKYSENKLSTVKYSDF